MEESKKFLTKEEVDQKVEEIKERFKKYKNEQVRVVYGSLNREKQLNNRKVKNRKRNKIQKASRKANR